MHYAQKILAIGVISYSSEFYLVHSTIWLYKLLRCYPVKDPGLEPQGEPENNAQHLFSALPALLAKLKPPFIKPSWTSAPTDGGLLVQQPTSIPSSPFFMTILIPLLFKLALQLSPSQDYKQLHNR